jgi:indole-3-glycerol phosphate synthase/phosphoribosylanthranilate isomerase
MSVLERIVARKRIDVAARKRERPPGQLAAEVRPTARRLGAALRRPGIRFLLECKRASPSAGLLRADFDPGAIARDYAGVADAMSVLTDGPYFGGSLAHLRAARANIDVPLLCKDFVVEPYQVHEARVAGADAVLLMLSVLDDGGWSECAAAAAELGMDALTEVHDETELERALALDARIVGINNRDLATLRVDPATTMRLAPRIPRDHVIVCESGIRGRHDVDALARHVDAFLVGSHLMESARLDLAARELAFGRVKVCGLTTLADALRAHAAGASLGGMIFVPGSPRRVDAAAARRLADGSPLPLVGVFADAPVGEIAALARLLGLHAVQLHGAETRRMVDELRTAVPADCAIWKTVWPCGRIPDLAETGADRLLLDGGGRVGSGGSGERFDWVLAAAHPERDRLIVAGGIDATNVVDAHALGLWAIDVNSGVESAPGVKDEAKLRRLFAALRGEP